MLSDEELTQRAACTGGADRVLHSLRTSERAGAETTTLASSTLMDIAADARHPLTNDAWQEVDDRYRPLVVQYGQRKGLQLSSAETVAQNVMIAFMTALRAGKIDRKRSRRPYLYGIAKNKVIDYINDGGTIRHPDDEVRLGEIEPVSPQEDQEDWEPLRSMEVERWLQAELRNHFSARDVDIFNARVKDGLPSKQVAARFDVTVNVVDIVVYRVRAFLREIKPVIRDWLWGD
jgi:RNA polymerase sigma factor (sigma-70 family)